MKFDVRVVGLAGVVLLSGCSAVPGKLAATPKLKIAGAVHGGQQPVTGATLQLYAAGMGGDGTAATALILTTLTTSDGSGNASNANANAGNSFNSLPAGFFTITGGFVCPVSNPQVYLVSQGGNPGLAAGTNNAGLTMMAALGACSGLGAGSNIFLDELTTVGSVAALYPYMTSYAALGSGGADAAQMNSAFSAVNEYTNTAMGTVPGPALPASTYASSVEIQTLGDAISACINSGGGAAGDSSACGDLYTATTPNGNAAPTDTIGALINILKNPALNVCTIYGLVPAGAPYQPTLSACPANWMLPISTLTVSVTGPSAVFTGATGQYAATVTGASNQGVSWTVNGIAGGNASVGTITAGGLYTAPAVTSAMPVTIGAVSVLSSSATGAESVNVQPVMVTVAGPLDVILAQTGQYNATVTGSSNQGVSWMVNGVAGGSAAQGTITAAGLYTAPAAAPGTPVVIAAQSSAVASASGSVGISVSPTAVSYATGDTRTVTQPTYPGVCATVSAQFSTSQRSTPPAAGSDDTARIQAALDSAPCKNTGLAVELAASGSNNAFYSELITVNGEGLTIDSGVTLYGGATYNSGSYLVYIKGTNSSLNGLGSGTSQGTVDGRGDLLSGSTRLVEAKPTANLTVYNVTIQQSIYPNLYIQGGNGITVWGVTILTPATRSNADGIDLDSVTNATVTNSLIEAGDDGVAVKPNSGNASNITVTNNKLYGTHGLSIGSVPTNVISNVLFLNNYVYGSDLQGTLSPSPNGLVIKQDPACNSVVQQVTYQNTCVKGVKHLITFYTNYSGSCSNSGNPVYNNIIVNGMLAQNSVSGAYSQFNGYSAAFPSSANLAYVSMDANNTGGSLATQYAAIALDNSSITPTGNGVTTTAWSTPGSVPSCTF
jgi:polygalacturonase